MGYAAVRYTAPRPTLLFPSSLCMARQRAPRQTICLGLTLLGFVATLRP